ncbi:hypothetical protein P8452_43352 [Trifolium repens]|nr:hypothetical protein P8452_43352 [Trifolium repens]
MPSRNVGGTKASKSQLVGVQGTNTKPTKQCRNIGGTKATMAEGPNKSSLNMSSLNVAESKITTVEGPNKKPTKRISPSFSLASHSLEKKSKLSTSNESRTKVSNEANSHVMKKGVAAAANESQLEHQRNKQPMKSATSHNESLEKQQGPKKTPKMPGLRAMLIDNFLKENGVQVEEDEELDIEGEEEEDDIEREGEIAPEEEGTTKKRTRGPTRCLDVHAIELDEERVEIILDDAGEPIGPTNEVVAKFSSFIGTIARSPTYCPLIYTTFKAFTDDEKEAMWKLVNDKYIMPTNGRKVALARIDDAWRRYKNAIKRKYFSKYPNLRERLKHRPKTIPKNHYKKLMIYWGINTVQDICKKNAVNRAKQKYIHRMGTKSFARVKAQMRAKKEDGSDVTQAEIFIETRTGQKGKKVDQDTQNVVTKLHDSIKDSNECAAKTFQSIFGKEKAGLVRCLLKQANPDMDDEALDTIMEKAMDNGASTSTHMHDLDKEIHPTFEEGELEVEDEDEDDE